MKLILLATFLNLLLCTSASAQGWFSSFWQKLDFYEAGTWSVLDDLEKPSVDIMKLAILEYDRVMVMRSRGVNISFQKSNMLFCSMLNSVSNTYGRSNFGIRQTISMPASLRWRAGYIVVFEGLARDIKRYGDCSRVPQPLLSDVHLQAINYKLARDRFVQTVENRTTTRRSAGWAGTLSAEIPGIPLKFELVNGKLTLKLSGTLGGLKFDGQIGRASSRSGIRLVRIVSQSTIAFYQIDKASISFEVPASTIEFAGDVATITYRAPSQ